MATNKRKAQQGTAAEHLTFELHDDGIGVITIDSPDQSQNTLGLEAINQASRLLDEIERDRSVDGVIFVSAKPGSFIAGADIHMISACESAEEATAVSQTGQRIFNRIANLPMPVVAAIDGVCLGGGLELALACHARVCSLAETTRLGLPEVQLGVLPGSGGTQRLPRLIGIPAALDLMLTGKTLPPAKARRLGLVDDAVPASILMEVALQQVRRLGDDPRPRSRSRADSMLGRLGRWAMTGNPLGRGVVLSQARKRMLAKTHGNYPAPKRIIDCVETGASKGFERGLEAEARHFGELAMTPEARALMGIYFATTAMKKDTGVADPNVRPQAVKRVGVLGAGLMGAGIALVTTDKAKTPVRLKDVKPQGLSQGLAHIAERIEGRRKRQSLTPFQAGLARRRVTPTLDYSGFDGVDLVIEAVFEELEVKHRMIADIERECPEHTIFATNTSSIPITEIAAGAQRPARVLGMHYFSPVERMPLLEVIAHPQTAPEVIATAVNFGRRQGKTPIVVNDGAGFYVNRILAPYINEAVRLLDEGVSVGRIDAALVQFGFPVGPFKLLDEVGLDVSAHVATILHQAFGERMQPLPTAQKMLDDGRNGRKGGKGFYLYGGRKSGKTVDKDVYSLLDVVPSSSLDHGDIVDRCVLQMVNEAVRCLDEGILRGVRDGDIGAVFGIGFPPFRGGPFHYLDARGAANVVSRLEHFRGSHGERFAPAARLAKAAKTNERFCGKGR